MTRRSDPHSAEPTSRRPVDVVLVPFERFARAETSSGILLIAATVLALLWANGPLSASYTRVWNSEIAVQIAGAAVAHSVRDWINDGLMVLFFVVVGLEIKREVMVGELASLRRATLPLVAALGGMLVPALIYAAFNAGTTASHGWGIPMATDIAFALGVLGLVGGGGGPVRVFMAALAIIDDIGAIVVLAIVYTAGVNWVAIAVSAGFVALLWGANRARVRHPVVYGGLGLGLWISMLMSGVHPTLAGVLLALVIPARTLIDPDQFSVRVRERAQELEAIKPGSAGVLDDERVQNAVDDVGRAARYAQTPLQRVEGALQPWVTYFVVPLFALANAGVPIGESLSHLGSPVFLGVFFGLVVGKQVGVTVGAWSAVRTRVSSLPPAASWRAIHGAGWLSGIGFTMAIFIAQIALRGEMLDAAKLAVLMASLVSGVGGWLVLRGVRRGAGAGEHGSVAG